MRRACLLLLPVLLFSCAGRYTEPAVKSSSVGSSGDDSAPYRKFFAMSTDGPLIPGLSLGLVPQGMAYWADEGVMIISGYSGDGSAGALSIAAAQDNLPEKILYLYNADHSPHTGHLGGLALSRDHLWIASGPGVYRLSLDAIRAAADNEQLLLPEMIKTETKGSFASFSDGILWIGEFTRADGNYPAAKTHRLAARDGSLHRGWLGGYRLNPDTDAPESSVPDVLVPDLILSIPDEIQGAAFFGDRILLSASYGRTNPSRLLIFSNPLSEEPHGRHRFLSGGEVPLWFLDGENRLDELIAPPMSEAAAVYNDRIALLFESAAEKYRKTTSLALDRIQYLRIASNQLFSL